MEVSHTPVDKPTRRDVWTALDALPQRVGSLLKKYESSSAGGFEDSERDLHALFAQTECAVTEEALARHDVDLAFVFIDGEMHRRACRCAQTYLTAAGPVSVTGDPDERPHGIHGDPLQTPMIIPATNVVLITYESHLPSPSGRKWGQRSFERSSTLFLIAEGRGKRVAARTFEPGRGLDARRRAAAPPQTGRARLCSTTRNLSFSLGFIDGSGLNLSFQSAGDTSRVK